MRVAEPHRASACRAAPLASAKLSTANDAAQRCARDELQLCWRPRCEALPLRACWRGSAVTHALWQRHFAGAANVSSDELIKPLRHEAHSMNVGLLCASGEHSGMHELLAARFSALLACEARRSVATSWLLQMASSQVDNSSTPVLLLHVHARAVTLLHCSPTRLQVHGRVPRLR
jgi:hypothetical protein